MDKPATILAEAMLTDEQLKAVGCIAIESSNLETYIEAIIRNFLIISESDLDIFIGRLSVGPKADILRDVVKSRLHETAEWHAFLAIYNNIKTAITDRNTAVHGDWGLRLGSDEIIKRRQQSLAQATRKNSTSTVNASELFNIAVRLANLQMELLDWHQALLVPSDASPDTCE